jgi:hypothetical protein
MIICNGVGFVHIPKTAGESIRLALMSSREPCYYFTQIRDPSKDIGSYDNRYQAHFSPRPVSQFLKLELFTCVRNPWDRYVSWYHWHLEVEKDNLPWESFIKSVLNPRPSSSSRITSQKSFLDGVEFKQIMRFENLQEEWSKSQRWSGISSSLPHSNKSKRPSDYRQYYTNKQKADVAKREEYVINKFNYSF